MFGNDCVAVENSNMTKLSADYRSNAFQPGAFYSSGLIRFPRPHTDLLSDEGINISTLEIIYDIQSIFLPVQSLLNQDASLGISTLHLRQKCPGETFLCTRVVELQLSAVFHLSQQVSTICGEEMTGMVPTSRKRVLCIARSRSSKSLSEISRITR